METVGIVLVSLAAVAVVVLISLKAKTARGTIILCAQIAGGIMVTMALWDAWQHQGNVPLFAGIGAFLMLTLIFSLICLAVRAVIAALARSRS